MATFISFGSISTHPKFQHHSFTLQPINGHKFCRICCKGQNPTTNSSTKRESEPQNALLKVAWYGSELLGIAASFLRSPSDVEAPRNDLKLGTDGSGAVVRAIVVETIKEDFARSYFVTGDLTLDAYEEDCEFADPAGSFKGLRRFKRNCTNFGLLIDKSNMKLTKWEDFEDKGIGHWRFSCIMSFPWRPILSGSELLKASWHEILHETLHPLFEPLRVLQSMATGYTEYYFDVNTGKVCRHVEHWNVPKMALLKQILRPSRGFWRWKSGG